MLAQTTVETAFHPDPLDGMTVPWRGPVELAIDIGAEPREAMEKVVDLLIEGTVTGL